MASQSIIKIDVGGQIFQTAISTLSKYPGSMLSAMFSHTEAGMSPMPKTEAGHFFLDVNPKLFEIVLEWLRLGEIITEDPCLLKGTLSLANYFGLDKLLQELEVVAQKKSVLSVNRRNYPEIIHLQFVPQFGSIEYVLDGHLQKILSVKKIKLARVPGSFINRYLNGEDIYLPISYDTKSGIFVLDYVEDIVVINNSMPMMANVRDVFQFLDSDSFHEFKERQFEDCNKIKGYLRRFGIYENLHYKVEEEPIYNDYDGRLKCRFQWNKEFTMKYVDPDQKENYNTKN